MAFYNYNDTEMFYKEIGEGIPFLLIHGWAIDHTFLENMLEPIFEKASKPYRRIYIDIPGMGLSKPGKVRNGDDILEVIDAFVCDYIGQEQFYIGGNSFGSQISRAYCAKHSDKILGMMLIAPALDEKIDVDVTGEYGNQDDFFSSLPENEQADFSYMHANLTEEAYKRFEKLVLPSIKINENNEYIHGKLHGSFSFNIMSAFKKKSFSKPVLILTGRMDRAVGYKEQFKWLSIFPRASYVAIEGAGHNIHVDKPQMCQAVILGWIDDISVTVKK